MVYLLQRHAIICRAMIAATTGIEPATMPRQPAFYGFDTGGRFSITMMADTCYLAADYARARPLADMMLKLPCRKQYYDYGHFYY